MTLTPLGLPGRSWAWLPVAAAVFALTILLGLTVTSLGPAGNELAVDVEIAQDRRPVLDAIALALHHLLSPVAGIAILAAVCSWLAFVTQTPLRAVAFGSITCAGWFSSTLGKITVGRSRPPAEEVHALVAESGNSFPSGHTALAASLALAVTLVLAQTTRKRLMALACGATIVGAVGFSRLYLGVHYPSDAVGSVFISTAGILAWLVLWNRIIEPILTRTLSRWQERRTTAAEAAPE